MKSVKTISSTTSWLRYFRNDKCVELESNQLHIVMYSYVATCSV